MCIVCLGLSNQMKWELVEMDAFTELSATFTLILPQY